MPGDVNGDNVVNVADVQARRRALANLNGYQGLKTVLDVNTDGVIDNSDVQMLISKIATGGQGTGTISAVPEPSALLLLAMGGIGFAFMARAGQMAGAIDFLNDTNRPTDFSKPRDCHPWAFAFNRWRLPEACEQRRTVLLASDFQNVPVVNAAQLGGIETSVLDNGPGRGVRIVWVNTGGGLRYKVLIDRGLDIADVGVFGESLTLAFADGDHLAMLAYDQGLDWLWSFDGV